MSWTYFTLTNQPTTRTYKNRINIRCIFTSIGLLFFNVAHKSFTQLTENLVFLWSLSWLVNHITKPVNMTQITVSPLKLIYGSITLLYGKNGEGKSTILRNFAGFFHRNNEQKLRAYMKPGYVLKECYSDEDLYSAYFNTGLPLRMDKMLTVREYINYYIKCLKYNEKYKDSPAWIYSNEDLFNSDFFQDILDDEVQHLSDGGKTYLQF